MIPIKIECACGQHYSFEVEPVEGAMPSPVACPACGIDATSVANDKITRYLKAWSEDESASAEELEESEDIFGRLITILSIIAVLAIIGVVGAKFMRQTPQAKVEATNSGVVRIVPRILTATPVPAAENQPPTLPHNFAAWAAFIKARLGTNIVGGYSFVIRQNGAIVAGGTGGYARMYYEKEHPGLPWTLTKPVPVMYVSNLLTAVGLLKVWEEKQQSFSLDDSFLPFVKSIFPKAHPDVGRITLRQLLTEHSSIADSAEDLEGARRILSRPLKIPPGTTKSSGYLDNYLARVVLEAISGEPYDAYICNHVLKPAGVTGMDSKYENANPVLGYISNKTRYPGVAIPWEDAGRVGADGWHATASDITFFLYGLSSGSVLAPPTAALVFEDHLGCWPIRVKGQIIGYHQSGSCGWDEGKLAGTMQSSVIHFVDGIDAVLLINSDQGSPFDLLRQGWHLRLPEKTAGTNAPATIKK